MQLSLITAATTFFSLIHPSTAFFSALFSALDREWESCTQERNLASSGNNDNTKIGREVAVLLAHRNLNHLSNFAIDNGNECYNLYQGRSSPPTRTTAFAMISTGANDELTSDAVNLQAIESCCTPCRPFLHDVVANLPAEAWNMTECSWAQKAPQPTLRRTIWCRDYVDDLFNAVTMLSTLVALASVLLCVDSHDLFNAVTTLPSLVALASDLLGVDSFFRGLVVGFILLIAFRLAISTLLL